MTECPKEKERQVFAQVRIFEEQLMRLSESLDKLDGRISPIVRPRQEVAEVVAKDDLPQLVDLAHDLRRNNNRLVALVNAVDDLTNRCEL